MLLFYINAHQKNFSEEEAKFMQERVQDTERKLTTLCDLFSQYALTSARIRDKSDKLGNTTVNLAKNEKINTSLAEGLQKFGESMHQLGDIGDLRAKTTENKVLKEFSKYAEFCKKIKKEIVTIFDAKDKEYQRKRQFERTKERSTVNRHQMLQAEQNMVKASVDLTKTVHNVEEKIHQFEKEKIHDVKSILLDFISTEMGYHAKSLEVLCRAFNDVESIDETSDLEEFKKSLCQARTSSPTVSEPRHPFFYPSQSLGSIAAIFSNSHRKRSPGIPHSKSMDKTIDSKRGIDSGTPSTSEDRESNSESSDDEHDVSDFYLKSVEDLSSNNEESVDNSPVIVRKEKNRRQI